MSQNTFSSKGNIITKDAENLMGMISFDQNNEITSVIYEDQNGNRKTYTTENLLGFRLKDGSYFVQQTKIKTGVFIQKLFEGKLSLYKSNDQYIIIDYYGDLIYLNPNSGEAAKRENYNTIFAITAGLCKIEDGFPYKAFSMDNKTLTAILREHHHCESEKYTSYYKQSFETDFFVGLGGVFQYSSMNNNQLKASSIFNTSLGVLAQARIRSTNPKNKKFNLDIALLLNQSNSELIAVQENSASTISSKEEFKILAINLPVTINYSYTSFSAFKPYVGIGMMTSIHSSKSHHGVIGNFDRSTQYESIRPSQIGSVSSFNLSPIVKLGAIVKNKFIIESIIGHTPNFQTLILHPDADKISRQFFTFSLGIKL